MSGVAPSYLSLGEMNLKGKGRLFLGYFVVGSLFNIVRGSDSFRIMSAIDILKRTLLKRCSIWSQPKHRGASSILFFNPRVDIQFSKVLVLLFSKTLFSIKAGNRL